MKFIETKLKGAYIIEVEPIEDERGFFARAWCQKTFDEHGLNPNLVQCNISYNKKRGTLRGMHFQVKPYEEAKLVRCTKGSIYDVIIDLRDDSQTFMQWTSVELSSKNRKMLYVPKGFAHGFQTLEDDTEVFYQMSEFYHPECASGIRWNDKSFKIEWPINGKIISEKDMKYENYDFLSYNSIFKKVILWGGTGQAKVINEYLERKKEYKLVAIFDNNKNVKSPIENIPIYYGRDAFEKWVGESKGDIYFCVAIGGDKGHDRFEIQDYLIKHNLKPITIIHPTSNIAKNVTVDEGSQVLSNATICTDTKIGKACIINTSSTIDHECTIGDGVHICPGAHLAGEIVVSSFATIGTGAVILPRIKIGEGAIIGAGAVVTRDVEPHSVMVGNPARVLKKLESN